MRVFETIALATVLCAGAAAAQEETVTTQDETFASTTEPE